jgi:hypothetical protein
MKLSLGYITNPTYKAKVVSQMLDLDINPTYKTLTRFDLENDYNDKITITGNLVRHHHYEKPISKLVKVRENYTQNKENQRTTRSLYRTRCNLVDTINTNLTPYTKFITLTYAENMENRDKASYDLKQFTKRFKRHYGYNLPYIGLLEKQKRGALHFHLVVFLEQFIPYETLNNLWKHGYTDIKKVANGDIGRYIAKYLTKGHLQGITDTAEKILYRSKGLKKPLVLRGKNAISYLNKLTGEVKYASTYKSDYNGEIRMTELVNSLRPLYVIRGNKEEKIYIDKELNTFLLDETLNLTL